MLNKLLFLENRKENISVDNVYRIKDVNYDNGSFIENGKSSLKKIFQIEVWYQNFIHLGKELYNINKDKLEKIKITKECKAFQFPLDGLILDAVEPLDDESIKLIKDWIYGNPVFLKDIDQAHDMVETKLLISLSIFCYLVGSSLNNYYNKDFSNGISFESFTNLKKDDIDNFYDLISIVMDVVERVYKLGEQSKLKFNDYSHKVEITRCYNDIYSLYWFILKMQLLSYSNNNSFINLCGCGEVILGRSKRCDLCKNLHNTNRKREQRRKIKEAKEKANQLND